MKGAHSISTRRAYGVQRVCRVWHRARSSVYARRQATNGPWPTGATSARVNAPAHAAAAPDDGAGAAHGDCLNNLGTLERCGQFPPFDGTLPPCGPVQVADDVPVALRLALSGMVP